MVPKPISPAFTVSFAMLNSPVNINA